MVILKAAQVIDGTGAAPRRDVAVVVEGERIKGVVRQGSLAEDEQQVQDLGSATILPGLIDSHVHLMFEPGHDHATVCQTLAGDSDELALLRAARNAELCLRAGITTVRDCGGRRLGTLALRAAARAGLARAPRILACGPAVTTTAGHLHYLGLEADTRQELLKAVRGLAKAGVDFVKVCATGGNMTAGSNGAAPQYTAAELALLVEDAHRLGLPVAAHALGTPGIRNAVEAGVDFIEHCTWLGSDGGVDYDESIVELLVRKQLHVGFTFSGVNRSLLPASGLALREGRRALEELQEKVATYRRMMAAGVQPLVSSDGGVRLTPFGEFASSLAVLVIGCGCSPLQAIAAATSVPAQALGLGRDLGTIEEGKIADLLVVEGDPAEDVRALSRVKAVYQSGRLVVSQGQLVA